MRVVHLTTEFPWPASGGRLRTLAQLRLLSSLPEVEAITLLSVAEHPVDTAALTALAAAVPKVRPLRPVFHPVHLWRHPRYLPRVAALRALGIPLVFARWASRTVRDALRTELDRAHADVVYVDDVGMVCNLRDAKPKCAPAHTVLDQHNVVSDAFAKIASARRGTSKLVAAAEHRAVERFERSALQSVDAVIATSSEDARRFEDVAGVFPHVVPQVLSADRRDRPAGASPQTPRFCCVGGARFDWFRREVWPRIHARLPSATFEIAGDDVARHCDRAVAMLAPVVGGWASRLKVLEGLRSGLPVVTTPDCASGLSVKNGRELLVASAPEAFADHVVRLMGDEPLRARLATEGRAYVERRHSLEVAQQAMRAALGLNLRSAGGGLQPAGASNRGDTCTR